MTTKFRFLPVLSAMAAAALLAGCTRNTVILIAPPRAPMIPAHMVPCRLQPTDPKIYGPVGRINPVMTPDTPPLAVASHVSGCAGVAFQVAPDGTAVSPMLIREWPQGYGFGAAALATLPADRFHPPVAGGWYYMDMGMVPQMGQPAMTQPGR